MTPSTSQPRPGRDPEPRNEPPFANSTEGFAWEANWCARCLRDAPWRNNLKGATGCPLLLTALTGRTPAEWLDGPRDEHGRYGLADQYICVDFKPRGGGRRAEPRPRPTPPGQSALFGRDGHEGHRRLLPIEPASRPAQDPVTHGR